MPQLDVYPAPPSEAVLAKVVEGLREELARLRSAVDQLRDELQFVVGIRDQPPRPTPVLRITSLPKDSAAPGLLGPINAVPPEQIAALRAEVTLAARQQADDHTA